MAVNQKEKKDDWGRAVTGQAVCAKVKKSRSQDIGKTHVICVIFDDLLSIHKYRLLTSEP